MNTLTKLTLSIPTALLLLAPLATPAVADTAPDTVIAADTIPEQPAPAAPASVSRMVGIDATIVNGLTVTGAGGSRITLTARGERTRTAKPARTSAAVFRNLTAGKAYSVRVNGTLVGVGIPVTAVGPAVGLTVSTTSTPDEVLLRWNQRPTRGQGPAISYTVVAKPLTALGRTTATAAEVSGVTTDRAATLALDPTTRYTFTVTPRNTASVGRSTSATMSRTLTELNGTTDVPTTPSLPAPAPAAPTPPPAPGAGTVDEDDLRLPRHLHRERPGRVHEDPALHLHHEGVHVPHRGHRTRADPGLLRDRRRRLPRRVQLRGLRLGEVLPQVRHRPDQVREGRHPHRLYRHRHRVEHQGRHRPPATPTTAPHGSPPRRRSPKSSPRETAGGSGCTRPDPPSIIFRYFVGTIDALRVGGPQCRCSSSSPASSR